MPRTVTNLLGLAVLSYLTERPMHAYELNRLLNERDAARAFKLSYGALYSVVRQLARDGLIRASGTGQRGKLPQHTLYELTDAGRAEMRAWLAELLSEPRHEYPAFAAALSLVAVLSSEEVADLLRTRLARLATAIDEIRSQRDATEAAGVHPVFLIEDDYRLGLLEAEAAFIPRLIDKIEGGWAAAWQAHGASHQASDAGSPANPPSGGTIGADHK